MKREFQNLAIECWQIGRLGVSDKSICLQAGPEACGILLVAIDELTSQGVPASRKLTLQLPQRHRKECCSIIRIKLSEEREDLRQMSLTRTNDIATFEFTAVGLQMFREAIVFWQKGGEDFGIGPSWKRKKELGTKDMESDEVWFWTPFMDPN